MIIVEVNTDSHLKNSPELTYRFGEEINQKLKRFDNYLSRFVVYLSDENKAKNSAGVDDKKCVLEARLKGMGEQTVTHFAPTLDLALNGAIDKMRSVLDSKLGQLKNH